MAIQVIAQAKAQVQGQRDVAAVHWAGKASFCRAEALGRAARHTASAQVSASLIFAAGAGLAGYASHGRRRCQCCISRGAKAPAWRTVRPPTPSFMDPSSNIIDVTPSRKRSESSSSSSSSKGARALYVHPNTLLVENALTSDSLRTLCKALAKASGSVAPALDARDRTKRPVMDATLTVRALLRFCELRHTSGDDLTADDYSGKCGTGLRVLLRKCSLYGKEVVEALDKRTDDMVRLIRAFFDQGVLVDKFLPFFRAVIEQALPDILRRRSEPLPRLLNFLEPYGEVQLDFLYMASKEGSFKARLNELDPTQLLEVTERWAERAQSGEMAVIMANKVRFVVSYVASLNFPLADGQRADWIASALWGSILEMTPDLKIIQDQLRRALTRKDPVAILDLAERMWREDGLSNDMYRLLQEPVRDALIFAGPEKASQAIGMLTFKGPPSYANRAAEPLYPERKAGTKMSESDKLRPGQELPRTSREFNRKEKKPGPEKKPRPTEGLMRLLVVSSSNFFESAPMPFFERALSLWATNQFQNAECKQVALGFFMKRLQDAKECSSSEGSEKAELFLPGPVARSCLHMVALGQPPHRFIPAVEWLLDHPAGWTKGKIGKIYTRDELKTMTTEDAIEAEQKENAAQETFITRALKLTCYLWPDGVKSGEGDADEEIPLPSLVDLDALLRLVGPAEADAAATCKATLAADDLSRRVAEQLLVADLVAEADAAIRAWRRSPGAISLSSIVAPLLLEAAYALLESGALEEELPRSVLSRSVTLMAQVAKGRELGLTSAEWALLPFAGAGETEVGVACSLVSAACALNGAPKALLSEACSTWLRGGGAPGGLGEQFARTALSVWERDGVRDAGLEQLRQAHRWLQDQIEENSTPTGERNTRACDCLSTLLSAIDGEAPSFATLNRARKGILYEIGPVGKAAMLDAIVSAWSKAIPGLVTAQAGTLLDMWWAGLAAKQSMLEQLARATTSELRWSLQAKLLATFGNNLPEGTGSPAWRIEGIRKVPWFASESVVEESFRDSPAGLKRTKSWGKRGSGFLGAEDTKKRSGEMSGRCVYCGSNHKLQPQYFWPPELGGLDLMSNTLVVCELCSEMHEHLGSERWGEVLAAPPEEAAEVWWRAQKKASMQAVDMVSGGRIG